MHPDLLRAASSGPDPVGTLTRLKRLSEAGADLSAAALAVTLVPVVRNSHYLTARLVRAPTLVRTLVDPEALRRPLTLAELRRACDLEGIADEEGAARRLRRVATQAMLRITARDAAFDAPIDETCCELSALAEAAIDAAAAWARARTEAELGAPRDTSGEPIGFTVIGMGKLGGYELNYSSDVDLIYLYGTDEGSAGDTTPHAFFRRVCERVNRLISDPSEDGFVFRVDLDLRPEGRGGPLCNSLAGAERYYEAWGRTWERLAWLRARPVGGDRTLGDRVLTVLAPWIYQRSIGADTLDTIAQLKTRIGEQQQRARAVRGGGVDLKLAPGGIRAIEFFVNVLQLLHAPRAPHLRDPSTLGALRRLVAAGILTEAERDALSEAYAFYRRVEHRLMMVDQRQTQRLPTGAELDALAVRLGYEGPAAGAALSADVDERRAHVGQMFDLLLRGERDQPDDETRTAAQLLAPGDPDERRATAESAAFADPVQALHLLETAGRWPTSPLSRRADGELGALGVSLLAEVLRSAEPDRALTHLAAFARPLARTPAYARSLSANPALVRLLVSVFATSDLLGGLLSRQPDLLEALFDRRPPVDERIALSQAVARAAPAGDLDTEAFVETVARYKQKALTRIGLADVAGELLGPALEGALSDVAEAVLEAVFERARQETVRRRGPPPGAIAICVLALGKLGGREMSYGSDLDLVFLYAHDGGTDPASALSWCTRLAQRTLSLLGLPTRAGMPLYAVDTRLRPEGSQGTLVSRLERFVEYHRTQAAKWERVALVRARPVVGDAALIGRARTALEALTYLRPAPANLRAELRRLRARLEREVARETPDRYNPKVGRGGLMDVEFIAQVLQIEHGGQRPSLRTPNTSEALAALVAEGVLDHDDPLPDAWRFLRRLDHRVRIMRGNPTPELRVDPASLDRLARRLGYRPDPLAQGDSQPGARLLADYQRTTARVRERFEAIFGRLAV